jgi:ribonucleoside-diphosphate reductase alpha chain
MLFYLNLSTKRKEIIISGSKKLRNASQSAWFGVLGYHSYLQKNMIPFESLRRLNSMQELSDISKNRRNKLQELANIYGEPELLKGYGLRNTTTMAIAPTTSSSAILGQTSPELSLLLLIIIKQVCERKLYA